MNSSLLQILELIRLFWQTNQQQVKIELLEIIVKIRNFVMGRRYVVFYSGPLFCNIFRQYHMHWKYLKPSSSKHNLFFISSCDVSWYSILHWIYNIQFCGMLHPFLQWSLNNKNGWSSFLLSVALIGDLFKQTSTSSNFEPRPYSFSWSVTC